MRYWLSLGHMGLLVMAANNMTFILSTDTDGQHPITLTVFQVTPARTLWPQLRTLISL